MPSRCAAACRIQSPGACRRSCCRSWSRYRRYRRCSDCEGRAPALPQPVGHRRHQDRRAADGLAAKRARADRRPAARRGRDQSGRGAGTGQRHSQAKPAGRAVGQLRHARLYGRPEFRLRLHGQRLQFQPWLQRHARRGQHTEYRSAERPGVGAVWPGRAGRHRQYHHQKAQVRARIQCRCVAGQLQHEARRRRPDRANDRQRCVSPQCRAREGRQLPRYPDGRAQPVFAIVYLAAG